MKFSELVAEVGHKGEHIDLFTIPEGEGRVDDLKTRPSSIMFCENITKAEALAVVGEDGMKIQYVPYALIDDDIKTVALNNNPMSFQFMRENSDAIMDLAVSLDGENLMYLDTAHKTQARCTTAARQNFSAIRFCNPTVFDAEE